MISLIDTNVILRFLTSDDHPKYENLYSFFKTLENGEMRVEMKLIVLFQVLFVLKSYYKISKKEIADSLILLLEYKGIIMKKKKTVRKAMELFRDTKLEVVDCYLIACLEGDRQNLLYSYDRDFDTHGINRIEP